MVNDRSVKKKQLKEQLMFYNNHERNIFTLFISIFRNKQKYNLVRYFLYRLIPKNNIYGNIRLPMCILWFLIFYT